MTKLYIQNTGVVTIYVRVTKVSNPGGSEDFYPINPQGSEWWDRDAREVAFIETGDLSAATTLIVQPGQTYPV